MSRFIRSALACASLCLLAHAADASPVTTLYNTGVNAAGTVLPNGTIGDPHYTLISAPAGSTLALRTLTSAGGYPVGAWVGDNTRSTWIAPNNAADAYGPAGSYVFRTTFNLSGFNSTSANIAGAWSVDNRGTDILLNGVSLGFTTSADQFLSGYANFNITSGFNSGLNTLDFVVMNTSASPIGLRVEMTGTANLTNAVPEPTSLALAGVALLGVVATRRRRAD